MSDIKKLLGNVRAVLGQKVFFFRLLGKRRRVTVGGVILMMMLASWLWSQREVIADMVVATAMLAIIPFLAYCWVLGVTGDKRTMPQLLAGFVRKAGTDFLSRFSR